MCVCGKERELERDGGNDVNLNWVGIRCRMRERTYHVESAIGLTGNEKKLPTKKK